MQKIHSVSTNERHNFHDLWQQHKQLETMKINKTWPDINKEQQIYHFQTKFTLKIQQKRKKSLFKDILPWIIT